MSRGIESVVARLLAAQDPDAPHSIATRLIISAIIVFANAVLYGVYGVIASVLFYLLAVELAGMALGWMFLPFGFAMLLSLFHSLRMLRDYWVNYGH